MPIYLRSTLHSPSPLPPHQSTLPSFLPGQQQKSPRCSPHIPSSALSKPFPTQWGRREHCESQIRSCHPLLQYFYGLPVLLRIKAKTNNKPSDLGPQGLHGLPTFPTPSHTTLLLTQPILPLAFSFHVSSYIMFPPTPGPLHMCLKDSASPHH